jgi:hypothetical protein
MAKAKLFRNQRTRPKEVGQNISSSNCKVFIQQNNFKK